jgi:hypothetical protein
MRKHLIYWLALGLIVIIGCAKEESFEIPNTPSGGSLQDDAAGDCMPKTVNGTYGVGTALVPTTNTVTVQVNVTRTGTYTVYTDTVNGYFFRATGTFTTLGNNTVTLRGNGTPFAAGTNNFVVTFDTTVCDLQVTVTAPGAGTLGGNPNACAPITVNGTYSPGVPLIAGNNAVVQVTVTTAGLINITTDTVAGIWFNFSGTLGVGTQSVTLQAQGSMPGTTTTGNKTFTVKLGASRCTFVVPVAAAGAGSFVLTGGACTPGTANGTYTAGTPLVAGNTVTVQVNVTTAGAFNLTSNTINGYSFSFSGPLAVGVQTVTLVNNGGTPGVAGTDAFLLNLNTTPASTCTFNVTVGAAAGAAVFTIDCPGVMVNGTYQVGVNLTAANSIDIPITVTTAGTWSIPAATVNGMTFSGSGSVPLGPTSITLDGVTTTSPAGPAGIKTLVVNGCSIPINVTAAPTIDWSFQVGTSTFSGSTVPGSVTFDNTSAPPFTFVDYEGDNANSDAFSAGLIDMLGGIVNNETYNTNTTTANTGYFYFFDNAGTLDLAADPSDASVNILYRVTSHNLATKTITVTFSGTAFDFVSSTNKTIANGTITIVYP